MAEDSIDKLVYTHNFTNGEGTFLLGHFKGWDAVTISLEWASLSATDAVCTFVQKSDETSTWIEGGSSGSLTLTLSTAGGSVELQDNNFCSNMVGLKIVKNSVGTGTIKVTVIAKKN
jgi:hypothetical protein